MAVKVFRKSPVAAAVSVAMASGAAYAQQAQQGAQAIEEIVVVGIRQSLRASMDLKRGADGVVDAITAEDIGDFPDSNLAVPPAI